MVDRTQLVADWLITKMPIGDQARLEFIVQTYKLNPREAVFLVDWVWNAGFNAGQENTIKEIQK